MRVIHRKLCGRASYSTKAPPECTHLGQLKLLVSEIEFLTPHYGQQFRVIYAGAAPGVHMPILAGMFPTMHFVLVDPVQSMIANGEYENIEVMRAFMTDTLASSFASSPTPLLFISDVRVGAPSSNESDEAQQLRIQRDMDAQRRWLEVMRPQSSILKFRLPWSVGGGTTNYPSGGIYFPVYGKQLTHEARLIVPMDAPAIEYDNLLYERQMAYFNSKMRPAIYPSFGGRCYDCTAFRWIVCKFLAASVGYDMGSTLDFSAIDNKCHSIERELEQLKQRWLLRRKVGSAIVKAFVVWRNNTSASRGNQTKIIKHDI